VSRVAQAIFVLQAMLILQACGPAISSTGVFNFERAGNFSMVCVERASLEPVPLDRCNTSLESEERENYLLYALVTQTSRGEIALVEIDAVRNKFRITDTDVRVPGYTFVPAGEIPSALVIPQRSSQTTYVAHIGSRDVWALPTKSLFPNQPLVNPAVITFNTSPVALMLSPDEESLFVALAEEGRIAVVPIGNGSMGDPQYITLSSNVPQFETVAETAAYQRLCPSTLSVAEPADPDPRTATFLGTTPRPTSFTIDSDPLAPTLLVADSALPIVHRFSLPDLQPLAPIATSSPVREVKVTPAVPVTRDEPQTLQRYMYAVDSLDGSLIVLDYPAGRVLAVGYDPKRSSDRITLNSVIRHIEVITPDLDAGLICDPYAEIAEISSPLRLRGVFLALAMADGTVRIHDIHDLDASCRGGDQCQNPANEDDQIVYVRRHRPRLGTFLNQGTSIIGVPSMAGEGSPVRIEATGVTLPTNVPDVNPIETCPADMSRLYPTEEATPLICSTLDPWVGALGKWVAEYEGAIPQAKGRRGRLLPTSPTMIGEYSFCSAGVLGAEDTQGLADNVPERPYAGDQLLITSELDSAAPDECQSVIENDETGRRTGPAFAIQRAYADRIELGGQTLGENPFAYDLITRCFGEFIEYEVRVRGAYAVVSDIAGFLHRVRESTDRRCAVNVNLRVTRQARALPNVVYRDPWVTFSLGPLPEGIGTATFQFELGRVPSKLGLDLGGNRIGVLPASMQYNPFDQYLYVVDSATEGLSRIQLHEFKLSNKIQ